MAQQFASARPPTIPPHSNLSLSRGGLSRSRQLVYHQQRSRYCACAAVPWWQPLQQLLASRPKPYLSPELAAAKQELLQLLQQDGRGSAQDQLQRASALMQQLIAAQLPFEEQLLGGGPWVVRFTTGTPQLWKATYQAGRLLRRSNTASQDLDPARRTVVNRAEYFGGQLYVTASGTYEPQEPTQQLPVSVVARISSGEVVVGRWRLGLPIAGQGRFSVLYCDGDLRVFQSGGARVVQVRQDLLADI